MAGAGVGVGVVADELTGVGADADTGAGTEAVGRVVDLRRLHPAMLTTIRTATIHAMEVLSGP
ncbi:hypothetical protein LBMAG31_10490 [Nitrosomonadaceae bacterium]|nr:hypothetical protein LBMAG31_10490 [Nitrosomonadaceae bacterium]